MGEGYQGGETAGGKWGCLGAAIVATPIFMALNLVEALGDCTEGSDCHKGFLTNVALPTIAVAIAVGLTVRLLVNWWLARNVS